MKIKYLILASAFLISSQYLVAQSAGSIDVGVHYTYDYTRLTPKTTSLNGGGAQLQFGLSPHVVILGDVTYTVNGNVQRGFILGETSTTGTYQLGTYDVGVRYFPLEAAARLRPFGEARIGLAHASGSFAPSQLTVGARSTSFDIQAGLGASLKLSQHFNLVPIEVDYLLTNFSGGESELQSNFRFSTGIFYRIGHK